MNNKGNELQGLVEPSRTITKYPQRRPSLAQELDKELKDLRQVSVNAQERTPSAEAVVDETVVSNESSGDQASESQPVQPKKSNRKYIKNKNKKKTKLSQSAPLNQTMHGQTANPQQSVNENETLAQPAPPKCLQSEQWENVAIPASIAATVEHKSPQQDPFIQKSDAENHILAQPATENLPSQVLATKNRPASTNISEKALPQHHVGLQEVALPLGPLNGQADAPDVQKGESESEQSLIAFPDLEEGPDPEYSAEDQLYMRYDPSQEDPQNRPEPLSLNGPPHNDSPEDSGYPSPISDCIQGLGSGTQGLQWAYKTRKEVDGLLEGAGVWLWKKPTTYYQRSPLDGLTKSNFQGLRKAPVTISHYSTGTGHPRLEYDRYNVQIVPHAIPWQDIRSDICHPDFLVPCKLMEYQACEAAGYRVWRHDRDLLSCRKTGCGVQISDYNHSTIICSGCGPKTVVRYCSFQHQVEDTGEHWQECGHPDLVMRSVIDHTTEPAYFANFCRVIHSKYGIRSAALHRQRLFASLTYGLYTLFNPFTQHPTTLLWPRQDPICIEMNERIERLLNVGLLACDQKIVLSYLYRLLRESLYRNGEWTYSTQYALSTQFTSEFGRILVHSQNITNGAPCECEWYGSFFSPLVHSTNCPPRPDGRWPRYGVKDIVENLEEKYWILRAWRQQHPTLRDWRSRATESVYKTERQRREAMRRGVDGQQEICRLGPGWSGWGGKEDSMCA